MTEPVAEDSFSKKFTYKLAANLVGVLLSFFQAGLVSRALGPRSYGDYNFLFNFFNQFVAVVEMRSATFLYTSISRNRAKTAIVGVYFYIALAISVVTVLFPAAAIALGLAGAIWPDQNALVIIGLSIVALMVWYTDLFAKICDALGLTVSLERARAINRILFFVLIAVAMNWGVLNILLYPALQFLSNLLLIGVLGVALRKTRAFESRTFHPSTIEIRSTLGDVLSYSHPLFVYTLMGFAGEYADRWLLQRFRGSIEQGLFSLALNIGIAFNILINALHPLVMREFSVAFERQNLERARNIFTKLIPASYAVSAFFLCYAAANAEGCVRLVGGNSFKDAASVFAVMAFVPILHNYSMLSGSALYAAHKTKLIRNVGFIITPLGIAATFLLIGPKEYGALSLGAVGLAVKVVALEFIGNNILLYFNCRMLALSFHKLLIHQISLIALLTTVAFICRQGAFFLLGGMTSNWFAVMVVGGLMYVAVSLVMFYFIRPLTGIDRREGLAFLKAAMSKSQSSVGAMPMS